ncbi:MAG: hypothetical protein ACLPWS_21045, partial [Rhodomicrobium sp.]
AAKALPNAYLALKALPYTEQLLPPSAIFGRLAISSSCPQGGDRMQIPIVISFAYRLPSTRPRRVNAGKAQDPFP